MWAWLSGSGGPVSPMCGKLADHKGIVDWPVLGGALDADVIALICCFDFRRDQILITAIALPPPPALSSHSDQIPVTAMAHTLEAEISMQVSGGGGERAAAQVA